MQLPENIKQKLDAYHETDQKYIEVRNKLAADPDFVRYQQLATTRNSDIDSLISILKVFVRQVAGKDDKQGKETIGDFRLTPSRRRWWDMEKLMEVCEELGVIETLVDEGAISVDFIHEFNLEEAEKQGKISELEAANILIPIPQYECDAKLMEALLDSEAWSAIRARAYNSEVKSVACQAPVKTVFA